MLSYCNLLQALFLPYFQLVKENICPFPKMGVVFVQQFTFLTCPSRNFPSPFHFCHLPIQLTLRPSHQNGILVFCFYF